VLYKHSKTKHMTSIEESVKICLEGAKHARSRRTEATYAVSLRHFLRFLDETPIHPDFDVNRLTAQIFVDFITWLNEQDFTKGTLQVYVAALRYYIEWLTIQGLLDLDYGDSVRIGKAIRNVSRKRERRLPRVPELDSDRKMVEMVKQMAYPSPALERNQALIEFLYSSGCRAGELAGLRVRDLDLRERSALVTGKGEKERRVYFSSETARALRSYFAARGHQGAGEPVFCRHDRGAGAKVKPLTTATIRRVARDVAMAAGIDPHKFTPHAFRHAFAIRMLQETSNLAVVQDLLGHSNPGTTRVYATIYPEELKQAHREVFR